MFNKKLEGFSRMRMGICCKLLKKFLKIWKGNEKRAQLGKDAQKMSCAIL